jgi:pyridoxamine 5'-phosphate oxidase family protein
MSRATLVTLRRETQEKAMSSPGSTPDPQGFSQAESAFLASQSLGRLAYLDREGAPIVVPVGFRVLEDVATRPTIAIVGHELHKSAKYHALHRDPRCALVVDAGIGPSAQGLIVRGHAQLVDGHRRPAIVIAAERVTTWGIDTPAFERRHRQIEDAPPA